MTTTDAIIEPALQVAGCSEIFKPYYVCVSDPSDPETAEPRLQLTEFFEAPFLGNVFIPWKVLRQLDAKVVGDDLVFRLKQATADWLQHWTSQVK